MGRKKKKHRGKGGRRKQCTPVWNEALSPGQREKGLRTEAREADRKRIEGKQDAEGVE